MSKIIFITDAGILAIISPSPKSSLTIEQIAEKDVPAGKPFKIIEDSELPTDYTFRDSWTIDESLLTDGVGADA